MSTSVIVPVRNAGRFAVPLAQSLAPHVADGFEWIVLDTASDDDTATIVRAAGASVVDVAPSDFGHGSTRNQGAALASGDILVFMTQDAIPTSVDTIRRLVAPIEAGGADATFARQVPRSDANPLERFARHTNYPPRGRRVRASDQAQLGVRAYFFSNSCSAVRRDVFQSLGGFPAHTIMNEDMLFASRLLRAGHTIEYVADAVVEHSHRYSVWSTFQRYFDIGVFFRQVDGELQARQLPREGGAYVMALMRWLCRENLYGWIPAALLESSAKALGVWIGSRYSALPRAVRRRLSMHSWYWR